VGMVDGIEKGEKREERDDKSTSPSNDEAVSFIPFFAEKHKGGSERIQAQQITMMGACAGDVIGFLKTRSSACTVHLLYALYSKRLISMIWCYYICVLQSRETLRRTQPI
jgi:hypothetical protein